MAGRLHDSKRQLVPQTSFLQSACSLLSVPAVYCNVISVFSFNSVRRSVMHLTFITIFILSFLVLINLCPLYILIDIIMCLIRAKLIYQLTNSYFKNPFLAKVTAEKASLLAYTSVSFLIIPTTFTKVKNPT